MTKKSEVSITDRIVAATLHKDEMSLKQIAERISRSVSAVSDVIRDALEPSNTSKISQEVDDRKFQLQEKTANSYV